MAAYIWGSGENTQSITVYNSGEYTLQTIPVARGCISPVSSPITVTVATIADAPVLISSNDESFCDGDSTILSCNEVGRRIWNTGDTTESLVVRTGGAYTVRIVSAGGCTSATSDPIFISIIPRPQAPRITFVRGTLVASGAFDSYTWYIDGYLIAGADSNRFTPTEDGVYTVEGVTVDCNSPISLGYTFTSAAIKNTSKLNVSVYPNPATNTVFVSSAKSYIGKVEFGIYNALGQQILSKALDLKTLETNAIDISGLPAGMYQYKLVLPIGIQQGALIIKK
jgi:Secretion system C-terminal sorting domain